MQTLQAILRGTQKIADAVSVTLDGSHVAIARRDKPPLFTQDGLTIANAITLSDTHEEMGAQLIKEAAVKTTNAVGDGATAAIVLSHALFAKSVEHILSGENPLHIKRDLEKNTATLLDELSKDAQPFAEETLITSALKQVGSDGIIIVKEGEENALSIQEGIQLDQGYLSPYFINNRNEMNVVLTDVTISKNLFFVDQIDNETLTTYIKQHFQTPLCVIKAPGFGERKKAILEDIAIATGGTAKKVIVDKTTTRIIGGQGDSQQIKERITHIKELIKEAASDYDRKNLEQRLSILQGRRAILTTTKKKEAIENEILSVRGALREGVKDVLLPAHLQDALKNTHVPLHILKSALKNAASIASLLITVSCMVSDQ